MKIALVVMFAACGGPPRASAPPSNAAPIVPPAPRVTGDEPPPGFVIPLVASTVAVTLHEGTIPSWTMVITVDAADSRLAQVPRGDTPIDAGDTALKLYADQLRDQLRDVEIDVESAYLLQYPVFNTAFSVTCRSDAEITKAPNTFTCWVGPLGG